MKALVFDKSGLENLQVRDAEQPATGLHDVLIRVKMASVNPIDYRVVTSIPNIRPIPHIPGAEFAGQVETVGDHVTKLKKGDRVAVYNRVFDGRCDMCLSNNEMLCRNGGMVGLVTNGGFAEYSVIPEENAFHIPDDVSWETAASLSVGALTSYHALRESGLKAYEDLVVFGASGNTGSFAVQFGKTFGANVIAVTGKSWLGDFGADYVFNHGEAVEKIGEVTSGKMADVVLNSLGLKTWSAALDVSGVLGRLVFFGTLTGNKVELDLNRIYGRHIRVIGTTGGRRDEFEELIAVSKNFKLRTWKKFKLEDGVKALESLLSEERDGRILLET